MIGLSYKVISHEYVDATTNRVVLRCIGWPSEGRRPDDTAKQIAFLVPAAEVSDFPLGSLPRLTIALVACGGGHRGEP